MTRSFVAFLVLAGCSSAGLPLLAQRTATTATHSPRAPKLQRDFLPLSPRERVEQLLNRFTFGPRPGEVDRVLAGGEEAWLAQQLAPERVVDAVLERRLAEYPSVNLSPAAALTIFPDRAQIDQVAQGKMAVPTDPLKSAVYKLQQLKWERERERKLPDSSGKLPTEATEEEKAAARQREVATATRIAGELFALPRTQRMAALLAKPIDEQIAFTGNGNLAGEQRSLLLSQFTPRERETFVAMSAQVSSAGNLGNELAQARLLRDVLSERQLEAVMTNFWLNHFNVFIGKDSDQWYTAPYEREVIRRHVLGHFSDLLLATAESPAMMIYLDNWLSIGPNSSANGANPQNPKAKRGSRGLNENYAREVMELHTVGVNGGYTQADVTSLAAILTGWSVARPQAGDAFSFDARKHEPGAKTWFGDRINDDGEATRLATGKPEAWSVRPGAAVDDTGLPQQDEGFQQGLTALRILAASPKTAHFISYKLAQYFVADEPPISLVDRLAVAYQSSDGDIRFILRALIASPEFNARQYFHAKVKTPEEFLASAFRATATDPQNPGALVNTLRQMGMEPYHALPPTGYSLTADHWMNSVALIDRLNFASQLTTGKFPNQKFDAARVLALGMLNTRTPLVSEATESVVQHVTPGNAARMLPASAGTPVSGENAPGERNGVAAPGSELALRYLESTVLSVPVSAKTDRLLHQQLAEAPEKPGVEANVTDTLSTVIALLLGSPEFQMR